MRNYFVKKLLPLFVLTLSLTPFISCQDVIFDNIRKEIELEDGRIAGDIRSIVRFKDKYYLANGGIYYKEKSWSSYGLWLPAAAPEGQVLKLAADQKYLYALAGISIENEKAGTNDGYARCVYYSEDGNSWSLVTSLGDAGTIIYNSKAVVNTYMFCTNSIKEENRSAYFVLNGGLVTTSVNKAYRLEGDKVTPLELGTSDAGKKPFSAINIVSRSCVWYDGDVYFFNSNASTTNETENSLPTMYYYGVGSLLKWGGAKSTEIGIMCKDTLASMGITADYILLGTNSGISHYTLSSGVPQFSVPFVSNAEATLSGAYRVLSILVVNPEQNELQTTIYASQVYTGTGSSNSAQFDHVGLWAYYPSRGSWNRE